MSMTYVYFAQATPDHVKIGHAGNPWARMLDLQCANWHELRVIATVKCESKYAAYHLEARLHRELSEHKIRGEWFRFTEEVQQRMAMVCGEEIYTRAMVEP